MCPGCSQGARGSPGTGQGTYCQHGSWCLLHKTCQARAPSLLPKGTVPSLSPGHHSTSCFNQGTHCPLHAAEEDPEEKGSFSHLSTTSALHRVKAAWQLTPRERAYLGTEKGRHPFETPSLLEFGLGGVTPESSVMSVPSSHTPALVKVTLACTCLDR